MLLFLKSGPLDPQPLTLLYLLSNFSMYSALYFFSYLPSATSHRRSSLLLLPAEYERLFQNMSAKQQPLPNINPVVGASGGAIFIPQASRPKKLEIPLPWKRSLRFPIAAATFSNASGSPFRSILKIRIFLIVLPFPSTVFAVFIQQARIKSHSGSPSLSKFIFTSMLLYIYCIGCIVYYLFSAARSKREVNSTFVSQSILMNSQASSFSVLIGLTT